MRRAGFALLLLCGLCGCTTSRASTPPASAGSSSSSSAPALRCEDAPPAIASYDFFEPPIAQTSAESCVFKSHDIATNTFMPKPYAAAGFGASGGLVAYTDEERGTYVMPVGLDGSVSVRQPIEITPLTKAGLVRRVAAFSCGFVVFFEKGAHRNMFALATDRSGQPLGAIQSLDIELRDIVDVAPLGPRRLVALATPASGVSVLDVKARSLLLDVGPDGNITLTKTMDIPVAVSATPHPERVRFADGRVGWRVDSWTASDPAARSLVVEGEAHGADEVDKLHGRVVEPGFLWSGEPGERDLQRFVRRTPEGAKPFGKPVEVPAGGLTGPAVWSGSHIIHVYGGQQRVRLTSLDCRPVSRGSASR